ncbi:hypothetical protein JHK86_050991 [Glycine max]|nr:hypothetical protein JHK86_050991 [Glycine max]
MILTWKEYFLYLFVHTLTLDTARGRHTPLSSPNPNRPPALNPTVRNPRSQTQNSQNAPLPSYIYPLCPTQASSKSTPTQILAAIDFSSSISLTFSAFFDYPFGYFALMALAPSKVSTFSGFSPKPSVGGAEKNPTCSVSLSFLNEKLGSRNLRVCASTVPLTGVIFEPFEEVKKSELAVPTAPQVSLARQNYADECESAINEQINVEYNASYVYHSLFAYFDRDNVALKGFAKFFKESSEEEREHAEKLMKYQNTRGGRVVLHPIKNVPSEFEHVEKGDALYAMELALSLEKLVNEKLLNVHSVMPLYFSAFDRNNDPQMADFIESEFLSEQVESIKKISEYVAQLRRVGKGHGVWHFDQRLLD